MPDIRPRKKSIPLVSELVSLIFHVNIYLIVCLMFQQVLKVCGAILYFTIMYNYMNILSYFKNEDYGC